MAYFQYYFKVKNILKISRILFVLKGLGLFLLILLLINPKIEKTNINNIKPVLSLLIDNSNSVSFFKEDKNVVRFIKELESNQQIQQKFNVQKFSFATDIELLDTLDFTEKQTNISNAIKGINELQKNKISPIVLITDGNQTVGRDYEFINTAQTIYPIVLGDTTTYKDVKIKQLNVNKYSYIKNKFPVEVILNYEGNENVTTQFSIFSKGKSVFKKNVRFSALKKSVTVVANLTSTEEGIHYYSASISKIEDEKNIKNNTKSFSVEVIDQQTKVLLLTSVLHPDLGAFKNAIESNKQRDVNIYHIDNFNGVLQDYQLIILFQLNNKFNKIINQIKAKNLNYLLVSGANTDWNFINRNDLGFRKNAINETENYGAVFNRSFLTFLQEDIGFNNYPPLKDKYGEVNFTKEHQTLLYQNINGLETQQPLLAVFDQNNQKGGVLFGEGIWRWRANSFLTSNSFKDFDKLISNIVQYLSSNKKRNRLEVEAASLYAANATIHFSAFYTDKNYQFDPRADLEITITNTATKTVTKVPFSLINNAFKADIENLSPGDYTYTVTALGQNISKSGSFKITDYNIEEQFTNANHLKLEKLANNSQGKLFYKNQIDKITEELLNHKAFFTVQKAEKKQVNLIDWQWILFFVIAIFTIEWFLRKYFGKI